MIYKWLTILALLTFCSFASYSQVNKPIKTPGVSEQQREKENYVKQQAVLLLKTGLLDSKSIKDFRQRTDVIAEASAALWDYDKSFAEEALLNFINQSLTDYKELLSKENRTAEESDALEDSAFAIKKSLKILAGKDMEKANLLQNKFFEIRQESLKGKKLNESLELALEGLEFDEQRTIVLLSGIIQQGIPSQFPKIIADLREKNPKIAGVLTQKAIQNLAVNPGYKASDAILLSVIAFSEAGIIIPLLSDESNPNGFSVFTSFIGNPDKSTAKENIPVYFSAVQNFFTSRLKNQASGFFDSRQNLIRSYFLIEKLKSYNQLYNLNNSEALSSISIPVDTLMQTAGFSEKTLADVKGYAERLANSNNPLNLDDGTNLFEKAENAKTPEEKLEYLIRGIIQLIEFKKYAEAERKIFDIENSEIRDSLYTLVNQRAAVEAVKNKNWSEFEKRTEKLADKQIKAFLYLKAISVFESGKSDNLLPEYAIKAEKNIQDISDLTAKAGAYVYLTSSLLKLKQTDGILMLPSAIKAVNQASDYNEEEVEINIKIPTRTSHFADFLGANSFRQTFARLAEIDWDNSQIQALQIKSEGLQAIAQIAAAKSFLKKMNSPK